MPILSSELKYFRGRDTSDSPTHGGQMNHANEIISGGLDNIFPSILEEWTTGGKILVQKVFACIRNPANLTGTDGLFHAFNKTNADGFIYHLIAATPANIWGDINFASARKYGSGLLNATPTYNAGTNTTTLAITTEGASYAHFQAGDVCHISNFYEGDNSGNNEYFTIVSATYASATCTITFVGQLRYTYAPTRVVGSETVYSRVNSGVYAAEVKGTFTQVSNSSVAGTVANSAFLPRNMGAIQQRVTLTFSSATAYSAASNQAGITLSNGSISSTYEPLDGGGLPYFAIPSTAWGGTFSAGDVVVFDVFPPALAVFAVLEIPAGSTAPDVSNPYFGFRVKTNTAA